MSHKTIIINSSKNGSLKYCKNCKKFQLFYKIFQVTLNAKELKYLKNYSTLLIKECIINHSYNTNKKAIIPTFSKKQNLILDYTELLELNRLLNNNKFKKIELEYHFCAN